MLPTDAGPRSLSLNCHTWVHRFPSRCGEQLASMSFDTIHVDNIDLLLRQEKPQEYLADSQEPLQACGPVHYFTTCHSGGILLFAALQMMPFLGRLWIWAVHCVLEITASITLESTCLVCTSLVPLSGVRAENYKKSAEPACKTVMPRERAVKNVIKWRRNCSKRRSPIPVCVFFRKVFIGQSATQTSEVVPSKANFEHTLTLINRNVSHRVWSSLGVWQTGFPLRWLNHVHIDFLGSVTCVSRDTTELLTCFVAPTCSWRDLSFA